MKLRDRLLLMVHGLPEHRVSGRQTLQSLLYMCLVRLGEGNVDKIYLHHYDGPYSPLVTEAACEAVSLGLLCEIQSMQHAQGRRYAYQISSDGAQIIDDLRRQFADESERFEMVVKGIKGINGIIEQDALNTDAIRLAARQVREIRQSSPSPEAITVEYALAEGLSPATIGHAQELSQHVIGTKGKGQQVEPGRKGRCSPDPTLVAALA